MKNMKIVLKMIGNVEEPPETHPGAPKRSLVMFCGPGGPHTRPNGLPNRDFASKSRKSVNFDFALLDNL